MLRAFGGQRAADLAEDLSATLQIFHNAMQECAHRARRARPHHYSHRLRMSQRTPPAAQALMARIIRVPLCRRMKTELEQYAEEQIAVCVNLDVSTIAVEEKLRSFNERLQRCATERRVGAMML